MRCWNERCPLPPCPLPLPTHPPWHVAFPTVIPLSAPSSRTSSALQSLPSPSSCPLTFLSLAPFLPVMSLPPTLADVGSTVPARQQGHAQAPARRAHPRQPHEQEGHHAPHGGGDGGTRADHAVPAGGTLLELIARGFAWKGMLSGALAPEAAWKGVLPAGSALLEMQAHSYWA